jgi:hypothetical protein
MRKLLLGITAMIISVGAYAQSEQQPPVSPDTTVYQTSTQKYPDGYLIKNSKMMCVKNQKMTLLKNDTTLANGTIVMSNGNYIKKGGAKTMLKEGEHMDLTGKIVLVSTLNDQAKRNKKMHLVTDTVKNKKN